MSFLQKTLKDLLRHMRTFHEEELMVDEFSWTCCSKHFDDFSIFNQHKLEVHHIDENECSLCTGISFPSVLDIKKHYIKLHCKIASTSYKCLECGYAFWVQASFYEHKNHCKESNILCKQIVESIIDLALAKKNVIGKRKNCGSSSKNEEQKPFSFQLVCCEEIFTNFTEFNFHKIAKHQIEQLVCGLCYCEEKTTTALYRHYLQIHFPKCKIAIDKKRESHVEDKSANSLFKRTAEEMLIVTEDCPSEKVVVTVHNGECTAQQEGILCQCSSCTKVVTSLHPTNDSDDVNSLALMKPYVCKICKLRFTYENRLKNHLKTHLGFKDFPCDICGSSFTKKITLKKHKLYKHSTNPFKVSCETCSKVFACKSSLKKHVRNVHLHLGNTFRVHCTYCEKTFAQTKSLQRHVNEHHLRGNQFVCDYCNRIFYVKQVLINHIKSAHLPPEIITCEVCGFVASGKLALNNHKTRKHSQLRFGCEICGKMFRFKKYLETHWPVHFDDKPYVCQTCGKCFKREQNLQQHQYTHSDNRPHTCSICGQSFRLRTHVKQHMAVHGMVRKHKCFICSKLFARKGELNLHLSDHGV